MRRLVHRMAARRGATAVEYLVMLILVAIVILAFIRVFGGTVHNKFSDANDGLADDISKEERRPGAEKDPGAQAAASEGKGASREGTAGTRRKNGAEGDRAGDRGAAGEGAAAGSGSAGDGPGARDGRADGSGADPAADGRRGGVAGDRDGPAGEAGAGPNDHMSQRAEPGTRINPVVLLFAAGLVLLLLYVMVSGKRS